MQEKLEKVYLFFCSFFWSPKLRERGLKPTQPPLNEVSAVMTSSLFPIILGDVFAKFFDLYVLFGKTTNTVKKDSYWIFLVS